MWLITSVGFFSIVEKPDDREAGTLTIRARVREDLEALRRQFLPDLAPIQEGGARTTAFGPRLLVRMLQELWLPWSNSSITRTSRTR